MFLFAGNKYLDHLGVWNCVHMSTTPVGTYSGDDFGFADKTRAAGGGFRLV